MKSFFINLILKIVLQLIRINVEYSNNKPKQIILNERLEKDNRSKTEVKISILFDKFIAKLLSYKVI